MGDVEAVNELASKLGFRPQKDVIYNRLLPYSEKIYEEAEEELKIIKSNLIKSLLARELEPGFLLWSLRLVQYIKLYGYLFSKEDHIKLIKLYLEVLTIRKQDPICISKWCSTLNLLLKKKYLLSRDDLQIDWKPLHELFTRIQNDVKSGMFKYPASMENDVLTVISSCRTYFPASDTQDMLNKYKPRMCPLDDAEMLLSICALDALLPTCVKVEETSISIDLWFQEFMSLWNSCRNDSTWENAMMSLVSRLSANNIGYIDFEPYFPSMYARFIRSFNLPVHFKMRTSSKQYNLGIQSIATWIISTLNHKTDTSFVYLEKLMHMIRSFLYSANAGRWSSKLKEFLSKLSMQFAHRIYIERYRPESWGKNVPEDFKLNDADIDRFVNILRPCLDTAMSSRRVSNDVNFALLYLSSLRPKIIIPLILEKLYAALDSLIEPQRLITTMSAAISVSRCLVQGSKNYPEGPTHIIPLLIAVLPGIDPNDFNKCVVTFQFIAQFISMIPVIDSSEAGNYYNDMTEEEHIICEATSGFEDFIVQFIDKICVWIESCSLEFVRPEQQSGEQNAKGLIEMMAEKAMQSTICTVLGQCSPAIFTSALKKVFNFISDNVLEVDVGGKLAALLCGCFAKVNPKETLRLFVPYLCDKIETLLNESMNAQKEEQLDGDILFNLVILSEVLDGMNEILPYLDLLMNVLNRTLHMSSLRASKLGVHMLTYIIATLTSISPLERKSSNRSYSLNVKDYLSIREWAHPFEVNELKVDWYVPGRIEIEKVQLLINTYLAPELKKLNNYSCGKSTLTRQQLRNSLKIVNAVMSAHLYLPMWDEPVISLKNTEAETTKFEIAEAKSHSITMPDSSNVRKAIADSLHNVQKKLLEIDDGDTKSFNLIAKIFVVVLLNEQKYSDVEKIWKHFSLMKKINQSPVIFRKRHMRTLLIDRANLQQLTRISSNRFQQFTRTHQQILFDLFEQGVSSYRDVRLQGQSKLFLLLGFFPYSYNLLTEKLTELLQVNTLENHSKYKGCLYILLGIKNNPLIARRDWKFIGQIWPLLITSMPSEKLSIINLITQISESVSSCFQTPSIDSQFPDKIIKKVQELYGNESSEENTQNAREHVLQQQDQKRLDYKNCMASLLRACSNNDLHWRYHLLAIGFLRDIVHLDEKFDRPTVKYFLGCLISESILVRKIATKVVVNILIQNKLKFKKTEIDPHEFSNIKKNGPLPPGYRNDNEWLLYDSNKLPRSSEEWNELKYVHDSFTGYYMWPEKLEVFSSPEDQPNVIDFPEKMNEEQKEIYLFFCNKDNVSKLLYYFSLEDKKGVDHFNPTRTLIFKYTSKLLQDKILHMVLPHLEKLASEKQESHQRCAAEVISGIIRGSKHWKFEKTENMWNNIIPILQCAIQNILPETLQDWSMCLCLALRTRDSRRYYWLMEFLMDDPLCDPTSLIASTKLHLFINTLFMQPWRNSELYRQLMDYLKKHMTHPFQLIRIKISTALKIIFLSDYLPPGGVQDKIPKMSQFLEEYMPYLDWLYHNTLKKIDNNQVCDESQPIMKGINKEDALKLFKVVSKFITSFLVCRLNSSVPMDFYRTLPITCVLQSNDVDDEIKPMCMNMLALLAQNLIIVEDVPEIMKVIESVIACPLWTARSVLAEFLSSFVFHNMPIISSREDWIDKIKSFGMTLLEDPQPEVRQNACKFFSGLLHCNFLPSQSELLNDFKLKARTKLKKSKLKNTSGSISTGHLIKRHAGILGLCAFICATPYDIPEYLPDIFGVLGPHLYDPPPIPDTIRKTICDFKRTHQDNWELHKTQFTEDQLLIFQDLTVPPSYYV